jgi:adenylate cyclase
MQRKLAAILAADVVGYSRLMSEDEAGTLAALRARRKEIVEPAVAQRYGRIFKIMGDCVFVEFASAVNAVECAISLQKGMADRNASEGGEHQLHLRVGINLGDVVVDGGDLYGDGVNLATRLQEMADPGGICVSGKVHAEVARKLELSFEDLGERPVKNVAEPVRVYKIGGSAPVSRGPAAALPLPSKPSIVVLPFLNMSGTPDQELFADGLTEDILTELSRFRDLFVISRNSSFKYKGRPVNVRQVARELGVQYVLEGSVRRAGNRVRVTAQLIDGETDRHIWAERYDRDLEDIFAIQDQVTSAIVATLPGRVEAASRDRAAKKPPSSMAAYECVLAGKTLHHRSTKADNAEAQRLLTRAIELDPKFGHAHAWKACVLGQAWTNNWCKDREAVWNQVVGELEIALSLDENDSDVHRILAAVNVASDKLDSARYHQDRALTLNPNDDLIVVQQGEILTWLGQPEEGIEWIKKAMRLNPYHPERFWHHLGRAYFVARRYQDAIEAIQRIAAPDHIIFGFLAACHAMNNDDTAAKENMQQALRRKPDFTLEVLAPMLHYKNDSDREHHLQALRKAGLPG